jgi:poly(rC)-binding protein 2/3/4
LQITGESKNVQNALFQVTSKLRDNILPTEMLNGLRTGSPYRRAGEISRLHQSADESLDSNLETSLKKSVDQVRDPPSSSLLLPQVKIFSSLVCGFILSSSEKLFCHVVTEIA